MFADVAAFMKGLMLGSVSCVLMSFLAGGLYKTTPQLLYTNHISHRHIQLPSNVELKGGPHLTPPRLLCLVLTKPKNLRQWGATRTTWAPHCDKTIFYSPENAKVFESVVIPEGANSWSMLRSALLHAHDHDIDNFEWFVVCDDSTFVVVENLKYFALGKDPEVPYFLGRVQREEELDFVIASAGMLMSRGTLRRFKIASDDPKICSNSASAIGFWLRSQSPSKLLASCLKNMKVHAQNAEDSSGRSLFNDATVQDLVKRTMSEQGQSSSKGNVIEGCCSDLAITFGNVPANQMHVLMFGVYRLRSFGHTYNDLLEFHPVPTAKND
uniref:C1GALT1-specific chaperone 1-like n=1 Tax=Myxine glutinosa TaxID=7769 RepID=UPI0035901F55